LAATCGTTAAKNEALANYYWAPLAFNDDGSIKPMTCEQAFKISPSNNKATPGKAAGLGYRLHGDIARNIQRRQSFRAAKSGTLAGVSLTTFKNGYPDAGLQVLVYRADLTVALPMPARRCTGKPSMPMLLAGRLRAYQHPS
jgi:hypothetical protein